MRTLRKRLFHHFVFAIVFLAASGVVALAGGKDSLAGRWEATVTINGTTIPFRLDIEGTSNNLTGVLFNGDLKQTTTAARFENGAIILNFEHYLTKITATPKNGKLEGTLEGRFEREKYISSYPFEAKRFQPKPSATETVPTIGGNWVIPYSSQKGEKAWRFIVRQNGPDVSAAILRVDGDTGTLTGSYANGKFVLSHFDGARPLALEITPTAEGTLEVSLSGAYTNRGTLTAYRPEVAKQKGLPEPADFRTHTTLRDPNEKFGFNFPDLNGKPVSSGDERFKDKVVVVVVTGTWCPNCHDEAQYLVQLYKKYRDQGLEIVALDFEEPEQQDNLKRARAFVKKYGVEYTYLLAGAPVEMWEKVPQAVNLNTWPATFFIGKDGKVRAIHAGFAAPASGEFHRQLNAEFTSTIEQLLSEGKTAGTPVGATSTGK